MNFSRINKVSWTIKINKAPIDGNKINILTNFDKSSKNAWLKSFKSKEICDKNQLSTLTLTKV